LKAHGRRLATLKTLRAVCISLTVVSAIGSVTACVTSVKTQPSGIFNGKTQYKVECEAQDETKAACKAAIAKTCPKGHTMTGYDDEVTITGPPGGPYKKPPRYLYFVCTP